MKLPILFFAAGLGTRMQPLVQDRPKPLINVAGKALLDHAMQFADIPQIGKQVVNLHFKPQMIRDHLAGKPVAFSDESDQLLETGGGLAKALPLLNGKTVATMNTDAVWKGPNPLDILISAWADQMEALLLIVPKARVHGHPGKGDFDLVSDGRIIRGRDMIYTGVQILRTETLADINESCFSMNVVWDRLLERKRLFGVEYPGHWCDVGQPSSIETAEKMLDV